MQLSFVACVVFQSPMEEDHVFIVTTDTPEVIQLKRRLLTVGSLESVAIEFTIAAGYAAGDVSAEIYVCGRNSLDDILEQRYGSDVTDDLFRSAGRLAGKNLYENMLSDVTDFADLVNKLEALLKEMSIGILRMEEVDLEAGNFILTVGEDLDCSGLPETGNDVCIYDEGFIAGILESFTGKRFEVREIDCWCTGERTCRFQAKIL
jgi:predicted hydrocarbon binding protein